MQRRSIVNRNNKKRYAINVPTDDGIGGGFEIGQLVMKSYGDLYWYVMMCSGTPGNVVPYVAQSPLAYYGTISFYDLNYPYQLLGSTDGNTYQIFLTGNSPNVQLTVSQSAYAAPPYIVNNQGAIINIAKPYLYLRNVTDGNFYAFYLSSSAGVTSLVSDAGVSPIPPIEYMRILENGDPRITEDGSSRILEA
jgi:hypothetical protein